MKEVCSMKTTRKTIAVFLAACLCLPLAACSPAAESPSGAGSAGGASSQPQQTADEPQEDITLTWWVANTVTADEQKLPQEEWYITKCIQRFEEANPGVNVEFTLQTDGMQTIQDFKASVVAGNGPDIIELFSGPNMLSVQEGLLPLNDYITEEDREVFVGWNTVAEDMDDSKNIYAYPYPAQSAVMLGYNKDILAECGYDLEAEPPQTIDELEEVFEAVKAAGYLPIHSDESFPITFYYIFAYGWVQGTGTDGIYAHTAENVSYLEDSAFLDAVTKYHDYYERGFFNPDAATSSDGINAFLQGECAFYPVGLWDFPTCTEAMGDSFAILATPSFQEGGEPGIVGGIGSGLSVASYSENPDVAVKLIQYITSKEEMIEYYKISPGIPMRTDITVEEIGLADDPLYTEAIGLRSNIVYWADNVMSAEAASTFSQFASQVLVGNMTVEDLARQMDESQQ